MVQHLSARIPWKDNGYYGCVCEQPCFNNACLCLKNIVEQRNDELEENLKGCDIHGHEKEVPCLSESGCFMSKESFVKMTNHPYAWNGSKTHGHFAETKLEYLPYSVVGRPYRWLMKSLDSTGKEEHINYLAEKYGFEYDTDMEPVLSWDKLWIQDCDNQRAVFEAFYREVVPEKSLVILYAKQVPFIEDSRRVVMGIGYITKLVSPPEYNYSGKGELRSCLWETMLEHSIRDEMENGFLFPYVELMKYKQDNPDFDMSSVTVFADDDYRDEFSYATEHVSYDAVIDVLNKTLNALRAIKQCGIPGNWSKCIKWTKECLNEVWEERGPYPGLGSILEAVGFKCGFLMSHEIRDSIDDMSIYQDRVYALLKDYKNSFSKRVAKSIRPELVSKIVSFDDERKSLFWLLARMNLTTDQAKAVFLPENRAKAGITCSDKEIIANPYLLYEKTKDGTRNLSISIKSVDMAVYTNDIIDDACPVPEPSAVESENDQRRVRAYIMWLLENEALSGHTVFPIEMILEKLNKLPISPSFELDSDLVGLYAEFLNAELTPIKCKNDGLAYQLHRYNDVDGIIRDTVITRKESWNRYTVVEDWKQRLEDVLKNAVQDEDEERARAEKIAILKEMAESPFSVLIGGAGTGKTSVIAALCGSSAIADKGVLLLAPTGKASVRMRQAMPVKSDAYEYMTIAQFLRKSHRYDARNMVYRLSDEDGQNNKKTVIIDEASMVTEEMMGALFQAVKKADRIILVGDPNQLPPIGAGRPFKDIVDYLDKDIPEFPKVGKCYGKLTKSRRQIAESGESRDDTELAAWFTEDNAGLDEAVFSRIQNGTNNKHVVFKKWDSPENLQSILFETIKDVTGMTDIDDVKGFDLSLGGDISSGWMNYGGDISKIEDWQILSTYRADPFLGTLTINRRIQSRYKSCETRKFPDYSVKKTQKLLGSDGIVFGDKVINVANHEEYAQSPNMDGGKVYVANGEVGLVVNVIDKTTHKHLIKFTTQPERTFFFNSGVTEEGSSKVELAYALTVHKAQGSEFKAVILVLGEPGRMISREMLYTAMTRQKDKVIILYNDSALKLRDYASDYYSDTARRFTNLFEAPDIVAYKNSFFESNKIHKTIRGDIVRSKSEVIIANLLYSNGITDYTYEEPLALGQDGVRYPDFTITNKRTGQTYYWEHCGMLGDLKYSRRWEEKKKIYAAHNITEENCLIVSEDGLNGSIDSKIILDTIQSKLL